MAKDLGIDLGTSTTSIFVRGKGVVLSEPSIVAVSKSTAKPIAIGYAAEKMLGRTPEGIEVVRPVRDGAIADFETAEFMLRYFVSKAVGIGTTFGSTKMIIGVPTNITEVEQLAVLEAAKRACGSGKVKPRLIEEPLAAAIGADLPIGADNVQGSMIIDIGGGITEAAVFSLGGMIKGDSIRVGGEKFDQQIISYMKQAHNILIGEKTAERIKKEIATVFPTKQEKFAEVCGRDIISGLPASVQVSSFELMDAVKEPAIKIVECAKHVLDGLLPEISSDIASSGIVLTGGGALLTGLCEFIRTETNVPVTIAENNQLCAVLGAGRCLSDNNLKALINAGRL